MPSSEEILNFLNNISLPRLSPTQIESLNAPITINELLKVIDSSKLNKSPGPDGLPNEYYKSFKSTLSPFLLATFQHIIAEKLPPTEMLHATVITIPKPGKPIDIVANYRPVSLLNCDIKLYSKLLADRINKILPSLVHPDQVGFVAHRQARDGTRRILNLIQLAKLKSSDSIVISLDAEKAFDRVNWSFLSQVLINFGFVGDIYHAVMSLYTSPSARVYSSGFLSTPFSMTNGTRQGCPLSPLIFALCIEPLAASIRASPNISGILVGDEDHKIGLYADDIVLICSSPSESLKALLGLIADYSKVSYYKLNKTKSIILPITNPLSQKVTLAPYNFRWADDHIPYLGILLTTDPHGTIDLNVNHLLTQLDKDTKSLSQSPLSWLARINLVKMLFLPKYLYVARTIPYLIPPSSLAKLQKIFFTFIWRDSKPRVKKKSLFQHMKKGGLSVPDLAAYNTAAILEPAYLLWHHSQLFCWAQIENAAVPGGSVKELLAVSPYRTKPHNFTLLSLSHLLQIWYKTVINGRSLFVSKEMLPITALQLWIPHISLSNWTAKAITNVEQLYTDEHINTFEFLSLRYDLPNLLFYQYLQIRHALQSITWSKKPILPSTFQLYLFSTSGLKGGLSKIKPTPVQSQIIT